MCWKYHLRDIIKFLSKIEYIYSTRNNHPDRLNEYANLPANFTRSERVQGMCDTRSEIFSAISIDARR